MPVTTLPNTARAVMTFAKDTREQIHVFHGTKAGGWNNTTLQQFGAELVDWWTDTYRTTCNTQVCLREVTVTDISVPDGEQVTIPVSPQVCGVVGGNVSPQNATQTISWRTGFSGRKNRGRSFTVGMNEADQGDLDTITGTRTNALAVAASELIIRLVGLGADLVVASYTHNQTRPIFSAIVENVVDSMRRRLPGRGR